MFSSDKSFSAAFLFGSILRFFNRVSSSALVCRILLDILLVVSIFIYYTSAILELNHNDFMYATAPTLLDQGRLYRDVPYLQAPLTIYLFSFLHSVVGESDLYVALRVYSLAAMALSAFVLYLVVRKATDPALARLFVIFFHSSIYVASMGGEIGNYSTATLFLSLAVFTYFNFGQRLYSAALTGLLVGLAAGAKLNYAIYALPFLVFYVAEKPRSVVPILLYSAAGILGSSLTIYHLFRDPNVFLSLNLQFHMLTNVARAMSFEESVTHVLDGTHRFIIYSLLQVGLVFAFFLFGKRGQTDRSISPIIWKAGTLVIAAYISAISPMILFIQYLGPLSALFSFFACACAFALVKQHEALRARAGAIAVIIAVAAVTTGSNVVERLANSSLAEGVSGSSIVAVARLRDDISETAKTVELSRCSRKAVTFSPIFLFGTPLELTYLSATGGAIPDLFHALGERAKEYEMFGNVEDGLRDIMPTVILVGYYRGWNVERRLIDFALNNGYIAKDVGLFEGKQMVLYIRGTCLTKQSG